MCKIMLYQITTISRLASFSLDHRLCRKLMGNTKAALPTISSTSSTKNNHRASPKYVFCSIPAHVSCHIVLNQMLFTGLTDNFGKLLLNQMCLTRMLTCWSCKVAGLVGNRRAYPLPSFGMTSQLKDAKQLII